VEILSPSNTAIEMKRKLDLYREAGVREYWVIDPEHKQMVMYNFADGKPQKFGDRDTVRSAVLVGLEINMEALFA
jgi:Uma2 family endonuclease